MCVEPNSTAGGGTTDADGPPIPCSHGADSTAVATLQATDTPVRQILAHQRRSRDASTVVGSEASPRHQIDSFPQTPGRQRSRHIGQTVQRMAAPHVGSTKLRLRSRSTQRIAAMPPVCCRPRRNGSDGSERCGQGAIVRRRRIANRQTVHIGHQVSARSSCPRSARRPVLTSVSVHR